MVFPVYFIGCVVSFDFDYCQTKLQLQYSSTVVNKNRLTCEQWKKISPYRPYLIYQYSNMAPRPFGQPSISGGVICVSKSLLGIERQRKL